MSKNIIDLQEKLQRLTWLAYIYQKKDCIEHGSMADPSRGQGRVLAALKMQPEISTKDLAYLLGIRTQSLNELLGKLERKGFITRMQSERDKRVILVKLTEKGKLEKQQDSSESKLAALFDCLNEEEQKNFGEYLERIIAMLEAQVGEEPNDAEFEWMNAARERFGENFDQLLAMRHGSNPFWRGLDPRGGLGNFRHGGRFGDKNKENEK